MGAKERELINEGLLEGSKKGRMFRANSGMGWNGKKLKKKIPVHIYKIISNWLKENGIKHKAIKILVDPRPFHGMPDGFPDLIGWESIEVCEWLNEQTAKHPCRYFENKKDDKTQCVLCPFHEKIAIFKGEEDKTGELKLTEKQKRFRDILLEHGGIYEERRE